MSTLTKIKKIKQEYQEVVKEISKPDMAKNILKLQNLSRKKAELERIILDYEKLQNVIEEIEETSELTENESEEGIVKMAQEELARLKIEKENLEKFLEFAISPKAIMGNKNVIVEIRPGTGGDEAELFAQDLLRMYLRFAQNKDWNAEILNKHTTPLSGIKEATIFISGNDVYKQMKYEFGVHRVQRVPQTEKQGRVHTSTASVAILPEALETEININPSDIKIDTFRSSGPGGQGVNTTDSAVRMTHLPTGQVVTCQDERSQIKNRSKALKILRAKILEKSHAKEAEEQSKERRSQIGKAERAEKIRTYNYPQDRITDHRGGFSVHGIESVLNGNLDKIIDKFQNQK